MSPSLRIVAWSVDAFGPFEQHRSPRLGPGLVVLHGPNEAGKSSLLRFLLWAMFPTREPLPPAPGGLSPAGELTLDLDGSLMFLRRDGRGEPTLLDESRRPAAMSLATLFGALDRGSYQAIHAVSAADLLSLDALGDADTRHRLFAGATAGAGRSVADARKALGNAMQAIYKPRSANPLRDASSEEAQARAALRAAERAARDLPGLQRRVDALSATASEHEQRERQHRLRAARLRALVKAWPHHDAALRDQHELAALADLPALSPADVKLLRDLVAAVHDATARRDEARAAAAKARDRAATITVDGPALAARDELTRLHEAAADARRHDEDAARAEEQHGKLTRDAARHAAEAGLRAGADLGALDLSAPAEARLREAAADLSAHDRAVATLEAARRALADAEAERGKLPAPHPVDALALERASAVERAVDAVASRATLRQQAEEARARAVTRRGEATRAADALTPAPTTWPVERAPLVEAEGVARDRAQRAADAARDARDHARRVKELDDAVAEARRRHEALGAAPPDDLARAVHALRAGETDAHTARARAIEADARAASASEEARGLLDALPTPWRALAEPQPELVERIGRVAGEAAASAAPGSDLAGAEGAGVRPESDIRAAQEALRGALHAAQRRDAAAAATPWWTGLVVLLVGVALGGLGLFLFLGGSATLGAVALVLAVVLVLVGVLMGWRRPDAPDPAVFTRAGASPDASVEVLVRSLADLDDELTTARAEARLAGTRAHAEQARERAARAAAAWRDLLAELKLPADTPARDAPQHARDLRRARRAEADAAAYASRAKTDQAIFAAWQARVDDVAARAKVAPTLAALEDEVRRQSDLRRRMDEARDAVRRAELEASSAQRSPPTPVDDAALERRWAALAPRVGAPADLAAAEAPAWLARAREALDAVLEASRAEAAADELEGRVAEVDPADLLRALGVATVDAAADRLRAARDGEQQAHRRAADLEAAQGLIRKAVDAVDAAQVEVAAHASAPEAWRAALGASGLPHTTTPATLDTVLRAARAAREAWVELPDVASARDTSRALADDWAADARALLTSLGDAASTPEQLRASLQRRKQAADEAAGAATRRATYERQAADADADADAADNQLAAANATLRDALAAHSLDDARDIEPAEERWRAIAALTTAVEGHQRALRAALGADADDPATREALRAGATAGWAIDADAADADADRADADASAAREALGAARGEVARVLEAHDVADAARAVDDAATRRDRLAADLAVNTLADHLLRQALNAFKERHAPAVLRVASEHLSAATDGAWGQVRLADDDRDLLVADRLGRVVGASDLSRGTTDLLYLCLRLGLAREHRPEGRLLPVVLDDVLVNLDPERAEAFARVLVAESRARQVLVLTCRPETVAVLQHHAPDLTRVDLERWAGRTDPVAITAAGGARGPRAAVHEPPPDDDTAERLHAAIVAQPGRGKAALQEAVGLDEPGWARAIRRLKDARRVAQQGEKRGATYHPA